MTFDPWPDERVERLKSLYNEGLSYSQIATSLGGGATRESISGKVNRLKLTRTTGRQRSPNGTRVRNKLTRLMYADLGFRGQRIRTSPPVVPVEPNCELAPVPLCVPIEHLMMHHCRYPVNAEGEPYAACGHNKEGQRSYCFFHNRVSGQRTNVR